MEGDGETEQLTGGNNTDHTESQRKHEENSASADKENEHENGERGIRRTMPQTPVWDPLEVEGRKMLIRGRAKKEETTNEWTLK